MRSALAALTGSDAMSSVFETMTRSRIEDSNLAWGRSAPGGSHVTVLEPIAPDSAVLTTPAEMAASRVPPRARASEDAVRLALRLRECPSVFTGRMLLFAPVTGGASVDRLVYETALGLAHLGDGPVIVVDLKLSTPGDAPLSNLPAVPNENGAQVPAISLFRPADGNLPAIPYLTSDKFSRSMERLRAQAAFVVCVGRPVPDSVETLLVARQCDAVILSVTSGQTLSQVQKAVADLRRTNQSIFGFVMDASGRRTSRKG